jgi:hypothetical protein
MTSQQSNAWSAKPQPPEPSTELSQNKQTTHTTMPNIQTTEAPPQHKSQLADIRGQIENVEAMLQDGLVSGAACLLAAIGQEVVRLSLSIGQQAVRNYWFPVGAEAKEGA